MAAEKIEFKRAGALPPAATPVNDDDLFLVSRDGSIVGKVPASAVKAYATPSSTDEVPEGEENLYFTDARALAAPLTDLSVGTPEPIDDTDNVLGALEKLQAQIGDLDESSGSSASIHIFTRSISEDFTIPAGTVGVSYDPTIAPGVTVTVGAGAVWRIETP